MDPEFVPCLPDEVLVTEWLLEVLLRLNPSISEQNKFVAIAEQADKSKFVCHNMSISIKSLINN